jgi:ABC-type glutathione transport system ATPase component
MIQQELPAKNDESEHSKSILGDLTPLLKNNVQRKRLVQIRNLTKTLDRKKVIKDFSLDIYSGEILCLLGNNGSGKTTLINLLTGLIHPD